MSVRRLLAALGAMVLLAGCGGDPKPKLDPTPTSPTTASTSTEPMSARQFVDRWIVVANAMQSSGDTGEYRRISADCAPCLETAARVESIYAEGGHIQSRGWTVKRTKFINNGATTDVDLWVVSSPTIITHANGKRERLQGGPNHFVLSITRSGQAWVAKSLAVYSR